MATDLAGLTLDFLKNNAAAATLRTLVMMDGLDINILESGDITPEILNKAMSDRRGGVLTKVLAISVQDAGETPTRIPYQTRQAVTIRAYDRGRGYRNLRAVREQLMLIIRYQFQEFTAGEYGLLDTSFAGRSGHRRDRVYNTDYEAVNFSAVIVEKEDD